jgi:hypothetical protein
VSEHGGWRGFGLCVAHPKTRMTRIIADMTKKIRVNPRYPLHPGSINLYTERQEFLFINLKVKRDYEG